MAVCSWHNGHASEATLCLPTGGKGVRVTSIIACRPSPSLAEFAIVGGSAAYKYEVPLHRCDEKVFPVQKKMRACLYKKKMRRPLYR